MRKSKFSQPGIARTFTLNQGIIDLMDDMLRRPGEFGFFSYSEIVRRGIHLAYREQVPAYKTPTIAGKIKEKAIADEEFTKNSSPQEYAQKIGAKVVKDVAGNSFVFFYEFLNNELRLWPLSTLKDKFAEDPTWLDVHLSKCKTKPVEQVFEERKDELVKKYNLVVE